MIGSDDGKKVVVDMTSYQASVNYLWYFPIVQEHNITLVDHFSVNAACTPKMPFLPLPLPSNDSALADLHQMNPAVTALAIPRTKMRSNRNVQLKLADCSDVQAQ